MTAQGIGKLDAVALTLNGAPEVRTETLHRLRPKGCIPVLAAKDIGIKLSDHHPPASPGHESAPGLTEF
jgi:hypothetical protein